MFPFAATYFSVSASFVFFWSHIVRTLSFAATTSLRALDLFPFGAASSVCMILFHVGATRGIARGGDTKVTPNQS